MTPDARIRIALAVALLMVVALIVFGALSTARVPAAPKSPPVEEKAKKGEEPKRSAAVEQACEDARLRLITSGEKLSRQDRADLEGIIQRQCK